MRDNPIVVTSSGFDVDTSRRARPVKALPSTSKRDTSKAPSLSRTVSFGRGTTWNAAAARTARTSPKPNSGRLGGEATPVTTDMKPTQEPQAYICDVMRDKKCTLVGETLDYNELLDNNPPCTSLTPDTLWRGVHDPTNRYHAWVAVKRAMETVGSTETRVMHAIDLTLVELGVFQLQQYPDAHFTFIDPRLAGEESAIIDKVLTLSHLFEDKGVPRASIVFSIPATLAGIRAVKTICSLPPASDVIKTNLMLVQGLEHAVACLEAAPFAITLSVAPTMKWHEGKRYTKFASLDPCDHPGMGQLHSVRHYIEMNGIQVKLLASDFSKLEEVEQLLDFSGLILPLSRIKLRWATTRVSAFDCDPLPADSEYHQAAVAVPFPSCILPESNTQIDGDLQFLPNMSQHILEMATYNVSTALAVMEDTMAKVEDFIRAQVMKRDALSLTSSICENLPVDIDESPSTMPNSPVKKKTWKLERNNSFTLDLEDAFNGH